MKIVRMLGLDIKLLLSNKTFYFKLILFPLLLILILGTVLGREEGQQQDGESEIDGMKAPIVAFFNEDKPLGKERKYLVDLLYRKFTHGDKFTPAMTVMDVNSDDEGRRLIQDKKAAAYIHIPADFTDRCKRGDSVTLDYYVQDGQQPGRGDAVQVLTSFQNEADAIVRIEHAVQKQEEAQNTSSSSISRITQGVPGLHQDVHLPVKEYEGTHEPMTTMHYASIGMTVMFSIMTAFVLIHNVVEEKMNLTYFRMATTPLRKFEYTAGKMASIVLSIMLQMFILIVCTTFGYGVNWGNLGLVCLITVMYCLAIGAVVLATGLLADNHSTISSVSTLLLLGLSFLGGSMQSADTFSGPMLTLHRFIPNGAAVDAYVAVANGGQLGDIAEQLATIAASAIAFVLLSTMIQNRRV